MEVALVVAELDVVAGLVLLDEAVLEDRGFLLRRRDDRLEVPHRSLKERNERPFVARRLLEVAADPRPQALGLADVDDLSLLVLEEVAAGLRREGLELFEEGFVNHLRKALFTVNCLPRRATFFHDG